MPGDITANGGTHDTDLRNLPLFRVITEDAETFGEHRPEGLPYVRSASGISIRHK